MRKVFRKDPADFLKLNKTDSADVAVLQLPPLGKTTKQLCKQLIYEELKTKCQEITQDQNIKKYPHQLQYEYVLQLLHRTCSSKQTKN